VLLMNIDERVDYLFSHLDIVEKNISESRDKETFDWVLSNPNQFMIDRIDTSPIHQELEMLNQANSNEGFTKWSEHAAKEASKENTGGPKINKPVIDFHYPI
jgi:hypothetical protein